MKRLTRNAFISGLLMAGAVIDLDPKIGQPGPGPVPPKDSAVTRPALGFRNLQSWTSRIRITAGLP